MRTLYTFGLSLLCLAMFSVHAQDAAGKAADADNAAGLQWLEDFTDAKATAAEKELPIMMYFTGSDWCGWCVKLHNEVFDQKAFQDYANKELVLMKIDFPRKTKQSQELQDKNRQLSQEFKVRGFPTVYLVDAQGKVLGRTGYKPGGAEEYVKHLKNLLQKK